MWIKREVFTQLRETAQTLKTLAEQYYAAIGVRDAEITRLRLRELELLEIASVATTKAAVNGAYADTWRLQVNQLTEERAALLVQLVPGIKMAIPKVEQSPIVTPPGVDFDDMGDANALMTGAMQGDGELRVDAPTPASVKGAPMFRDPGELDDLDNV